MGMQNVHTAGEVLQQLGAPDSAELWIDQKPLQRDQKLQELTIQEPAYTCVVERKPDEFSVSMKTLTGKIFQLSVSPSDTMDAVKHRCHALETLWPQHHGYVSAKSARKDAETVAEAGWKEGDMIYVLIKGCFGHHPSPYGDE
jgi:hypothetical protein